MSSCAAVLLLSACAQLPLARDSEELPPPPVEEVAARGVAGGVFNPAAGWSLLSDRRAFRSGDVLTVLSCSGP